MTLKFYEKIGEWVESNGSHPNLRNHFGENKLKCYSLLSTGGRNICDFGLLHLKSEGVFLKLIIEGTLLIQKLYFFVKILEMSMNLKSNQNKLDLLK